MGRQIKVLVTGASGQLGQCFQDLVEKSTDSSFDFEFRSSAQLDILDSNAITKEFEEHDYDYCINCAAYTQVDKAETEVELATKINAQGPQNLAIACNKVSATMVHISTDFVFDGKASAPYSEEDECNPLGVYGRTKLEGEKGIAAVLKNHFVIRTSWLYSEYGNNFMKTMLRLGSERDELSVVVDQQGTPTYAKDLARVILQIITSESREFGTYHFSNEGETTWYGFASKIFELANIQIDLKSIPTKAYPTPAKRPAYSVLDKSKIKKTFGIEILDWEEKLREALKAHSSLTT